MLNCDIKVEGNIATIKIDLSKTFGRSKSGKTITVASTKGNIPIPGTDCVAGINVYKFPENE